MKAYELLFFVNPALEEDARTALSKRIDSAITSQGGTVDNIDEWGKRKLTYEINKLTDGDYTLIEFHAEPTNIAEIDRILRITDAIERFIIVRRKDCA
ncbi:MAG: 30S ribosomal protein S6 [Coriobacteriia bacterium]|jgi:small subunit ribosomal protein S6|nr:30S ribosomal protein S6 [Coriobacteriia bacterium]MDR2714476.1 30S ribosomal protein S6 [Coriobacteriales bacterium]